MRLPLEGVARTAAIAAVIGALGLANPQPACAQSGSSEVGSAEAEALPRSIVFGREVEVWVRGSRSRGELLAVAGDSLWIGSEDSLRLGLPLDEVSRVRVRMHEWDANRVLLWNGIGAGVASGALYAACTSVESECWGVFLVVPLTWAVVGGLFGWALASTSTRELEPTPAILQPYVRFPQGLPDGFGGAIP